MNILLTGAEGNFGTEFRRQSADYDTATVIPVGRGDWSQIHDKLAGVDVVVHAASDLRTSASLAPSRLLDSNVMSTAVLLEAALKSRVKKFVFLSSCAVYGEDMRTGEDSLCAPITINGISKHLGEKLVAEFCTANGIEHQILRVFNSYGGHDKFSIFSHLERALLQGTAFTLNNLGRMQRDFVHVADVASIVLKLSTSAIGYTHLNIGTGTATKVSVLVDMLTARFPQLVVQHGVTQEAEYSRADTSRLREFWVQDFVRLEDFVQQTFAPSIAAALDKGSQAQ
jgi:UDP-glucose 4-epimerase